ncbi:MAG: hypothetical protein ACI9RU_000548 [Litorivivens sp.]|jgi:hypothetical protein
MRLFIITATVALSLSSCYSYKWNLSSRNSEPAPSEITALFAQQSDGILHLDAQSPGYEYGFDIGEKDSFYGKTDQLRFTDIQLHLHDKMASGQVVVDFEFKDQAGTSVKIPDVDLMRLIPTLDSDGDLLYAELLLEEFNRFGVNFRGEHNEFTMSNQDGKMNAQPYRANITNNCLAASKWEFALTSESYDDMGSRYASNKNLNQNKILSHTWFYLNPELYRTLIQLKNPGKEIPSNIEYNDLSDYAESVVVDFEQLRRPLKRRVDVEQLEIGHQSGRLVEPLDLEEHYKREFGLLLNKKQFTYTSILEEPIQTMQFQDRGYYTAETPKEFDFSWMKHVDSIQMDVIDIKGSESYVQLTLTGEWSPYDITLGNVDLALINEQQLYGMLFGMNTFPKSRRYNPVQSTIQFDAALLPDDIKPFVLLTDKKTGQWVNNQYKGVEKIYLTYESLEMDVLNIYVLCYERITPVWMGTIKLPKEIRETVRIRKKLYNY